MSLDIGDLIDGLCSLFDIGPIKYNPGWSFWRRCCWFVWRLVWVALVITVSLGLIFAVIGWLTG